MPHRVPFDNALARLCGLGDLDKLEREQKMRQAHRYYNRPQHPTTEDRTLGYYNNNRHPLGIPPSPYHHHQPFISNGLNPNPQTRRRQAEEPGLYYPGPGQRLPARRPLGRDVDDWDQEQVETYYYFHQKDMKRFKSYHKRPDGGLPQYSTKGWVRRYHEFIESLVHDCESRMNRQGHGYGGRGRAPRRRYQVGEGYDEDDDDEDDFDD